MKNNNPRQNTGFSILELLITLAIIAILTSIGWPLYTGHLIKTRRAQAKVALMQLASKLEHYAIQHHSYQDATLSQLGIKAKTAEGYYQLQIQTLSQDQFQIAAVPQKTQTQDTECGTLTLNQVGQKTSSGTDNSKNCW